MIDLQQRVEGREVGREELSTTSSVPVDGVVDLLQTRATVSGRGKFVKGVCVCKSIVLSKLVLHLGH